MGKPKIRFKGFTEDWEQCKLGEFLEVSGEKNFDGTFTRDDVLSVSGELGIVNQIEFQGRSFAGASVLNYGVVGTGDVVYTKSPLKTNPYGIIKTNKGKPGIVSTLYAVYHGKANVFSDFIQCYFEQNARVNNYLHPLVNKGAKNDMKVSAENALKGIVSFPKYEEQMAIARFFSVLDHLITLHQRKYDEAKKLKKYMLQKMFPQNGMKVPEIRFEGFTEDWEQRKVKNIAPLQRGFDLPTSQMEEGVYPVVMSNGIGGYHSQYKVKGPGIVTGRSGTIGKLHYIEDDYWPHNTTLWVTDFNGNNQKFIYYMYQCLDLSRFSTGSGVPTLNRNDVHDEVICISSMGEQKKISDYLTNLDYLITLHQRKCDELVKIKKYMLQNMFV
ncbi:restriction endonuclease subunit S [Lachnospiraceae bacterium WCA-9-b2]|uniref:Restriction endonuclease subunit S n=1 Tax=Sporofaciens musculi TaxID=2681861 RepID=A0A7X3ML73_9FIRM|nr:restriction endonuclease subunit S [Sporofaciens musculi]MXP78320.1 restriction endonuclease subunit S [Sporofaciens musculi]